MINVNSSHDVIFLGLCDRKHESNDKVILKYLFDSFGEVKISHIIDQIKI